MHGSVVRSASDRAVEAGERLLRTPQRQEHETAMRVGLLEVGPQGDGSVVAGERLLQAPHIAERVPQMPMRRSHRSIVCNGP